MNILKIKDLEKCYNSNYVVKKINLSVEKGSIYGLLGPNGAGKSTTISMITGLKTPNSGEIIFEEKIKNIKAWRKNLGLVPQDFALYWDLTAEENVKFFCSLYNFKGKELKEKVLKALEFVGLLDVKDKKASTFSGGMKRRLNIACAIAHSPKLIIMDEPTVGIDPQSRNHIMESVRKLRDEGATIIYTTHYMEEVEALCDTIAIIDHGKVIAVGTSAELKANISNKNIYTLELDNSPLVAKKSIEEIPEIYRVEISNNKVSCFYSNNNKTIESIVSAVSKHNLNIINIKSEVPSLETVFLSLTGKSLRD